MLPAGWGDTIFSGPGHQVGVLDSMSDWPTYLSFKFKPYHFQSAYSVEGVTFSSCFSLFKLSITLSELE